MLEFRPTNSASTEILGESDRSDENRILTRRYLH
jgi:hypothetical protein